MSTAQNTPSRSFSDFFWALWAKTYIFFFLVFLGVNTWLAYKYGWISLIKGWGVVFVLIGIATNIYSVRCMQLAQQSKNWMPVTARILSSKVTVEQQSSSNFGHGVDHYTYYFPEVEYEYEYQGIAYRSDHVLFFRINYPAAEAETMIQRYPAGSQVMAYINPHKPSQCVLEPGLEKSRGKYLKGIFIGDLFVVIGIVGSWVLPRFIHV
jgi:hypothetical protein